MTPFAALCSLAGLSHREAGAFLAVRPDTVKSWSAGRNRVPSGVIAQMRTLIARQETAAAETLAQVQLLARDHAPPDQIEIGYPADDYEAQMLGWPCAGAWRAMAARIIAVVDLPIILVPRGSTPATAAAADAHRH